MCGHGTIGVATVLVETGMVAVTEPETVVRLDVPAGLVEARVAVEDGRARRVTLRNVPSFLHARDRTVEADGIGEVAYDMAFGGNFYAIVDAASAGVEVDPARAASSSSAARRSWRRSTPPTARCIPRTSASRAATTWSSTRPGATAPTRARRRRSIPAGSTARPCGTGTSARMAQLHARGELAIGEAFVNESVIGTRFTGRLVEETEVGGRPAVVPEITGRAWITGMGQYLLDAEDPFPAGFAL